VVELEFDCVGSHADRYAVVPTLTLRLRVTEHTGTPIYAIALRCQIRIEPQRRRYTPEEAVRLHDLFGEAARWSQTVKPIQFTIVTAMVPSFTGEVEVDLSVPCTYDLEIAAARYFHALEGDAAPLLLLFSGTVLGTGEHGIAVEPVPWSAECGYRLPVPVWREMVDRHFPNSGWLRMSRETLDALARYKSRHALPTWDATIASLLSGDRDEVPG
jgi:Family of unknown function (DUF6084)